MPIPAEPLTGGRASTKKALDALGDRANPRAHEFSREIGLRSAHRAAQTPEARLDAADERDAVALVRDLAARTRDDVADARCAEQHAGHEPADERGAQAAGDRQAAAEDREQAARERLHALVDREVLADELAIADTDPLTGARTRAAGLTDLALELERCRRTGCGLVVAYVDVVGLKNLNDTQGHEAGDDMLRGVVRVIKEHLRPYDLVFRLGGDEFLCAMSGMSLPETRDRFARIAGMLATAHSSAAIRNGFAELSPGDGIRELMARADSEMIDGRHASHQLRVAPAASSRMEPRERLGARAENVAPLRRAVVAFAAAGGASERQLEDIAVAVSEALTNVVLHAYAGHERPAVMSLHAWMSERSLDVVVQDEGVGMVPRPRGPGLGLGLGLIVRMTRQLAIEETADGTRVRMTFAIG